MLRSAFNPIAAAKRLALAAFDAIGLTAIAFMLSLSLTTPAFAYVDPSVMTYTIQALAGVAVALSAVAGVAFRRSRRAIMRALNIDENRNKTIDPPWVEIAGSKDNIFMDESQFEDVTHAVVTGKAGKEKEPRVKRGKKYSPPFGLRLILAFAVSVFASLTLFVIAPYETLAGNTSSLTFGLYDVWQPIAIAAAVIAIALTIIISVLRGVAFNAAVIAVFCFGLCCYVQALLLNFGLPTTDGRTSSWNGYTGNALISTLVWIVLFLIPFVASKFNRKIVQTIVGVLSAALVIVQGVAVGSLLTNAFNEVSTAEEEGVVSAERYLMTEKDMFTVSPKKNAIVFVLDTFDTSDMETLVENDPSIEKTLDGFTWFRNSIGSLSPTRYGCVFLWTGEYPHKDEPFEQFVEERYKRSSFLSDIHDADYSIGLYTDPLGDYLLSDEERRELIYDKTVNIKPPDPGSAPILSIEGTLQAMAQCACYRDFPGILKPFWYFNTDEINNAMVANIESTAEHNEAPYVMNDAEWYKHLKERGLTLDEESEKEGAYRFIHLNGTHLPYTLDENGNEAPEKTDVEEQAHGSMKMVLHYLNQMKKLGVYDDAEIIITADHGIWWESEPDTFGWVSSPLMLVKPANAPDEDLEISEASITAYDVLPTVIDYVTGDASSYGPTLFEQDNPSRDRRYYFTHTIENKDLQIEEFQIIGDALVENNWKKTGYTIDPSDTPRS